MALLSIFNQLVTWHTQTYTCIQCTKILSHTSLVAGREQTIPIYLRYCEEVITVPSHSTRAPIMLSNCSIRVLTERPSQRNCSSDWLRGPGGEAGTWEVRGVIIIRSKEGRERARDAVDTHSHKDWRQMALMGSYYTEGWTETVGETSMNNQTNHNYVCFSMCFFYILKGWDDETEFSRHKKRHVAEQTGSSACQPFLWCCTLLLIFNILWNKCAHLLIYLFRRQWPKLK